MSKKVKNLIIILIILIIIVATILVILINRNDSEIAQVNEGIESTDENVSHKDKLSKVEEKYEYFDVQTCVNNFIKTLKNLNSDIYKKYATNSQSEQEMKEYISSQEQVLYNQLGFEYINKFNITQENVSNIFSKYYKINLFNIKNIRGIDINDDLAIYVVDGEILYSNNVTEEYEIIVKKYSKDLTFSIYPYEYMKEVGGLENALENLKQHKTVENKYDNSYVSKAYDNEYICNYYFNDFKNNIIINSKYIYNKLDEQYKQKRFNNIEIFKQYIIEKQIERENIVLREFLIEENNNNTINYVCKDQYGNLYIFKQSVIGDYTLMLDTYTIEQTKFTTEYNKANNQKKVMMNIDKFFQMINSKDYTAAYNCLASEFKQKYFKTEESFKTYAKNNFYKYNNITYKTFNDKFSGVYGYELILIDKQDTSKSKLFNVVMKLNDKTDFEMSFEI